MKRQNATNAHHLSQTTSGVLLVRRFLVLALIIVIACIHCPQGRAQTNLANIIGTVKDASGAVVPNCRVEIMNKQTSAVRNAVTDASGFYSAPSLTVGSYTITATIEGFQKTTQSVDLTLDGLTANFQLKVGSVSEITVNGAYSSVGLQTDSHEVSLSVNSEQLVNLPNSGRSILNIATLGPASQPGGDAGNAVGDESAYAVQGDSVILAGLGNAQTQFLQDGIDNTNLLTQTANISASVEAAQEVSTIVSNAPARFGEPSVVNVITKSGSSKFHGVAYDFLQNDASNARNWFATSKAPLRYNLFGGNLGGPIFKDKLFGFFDYSGLRSHQGNLASVRVPTVAERMGDFSADPGTIYDPATYNTATGTSSPFSDNRIPVISPFAQLWLQNFPLPNVPLSVSNVNYIANIPTINNFDEFMGRIDWNASAKNLVFGTFSRLVRSDINSTITPGLFGISYPLKGTNISLSDTVVINEHAVNVAQVGYNRNNLFRDQEGAGVKNYAQFYGLKNVNPPLAQSVPPSIAIANYPSLGDQYSPQGAIQNRYQFADEVDWKLGQHTISFGGEFVRVQFDGEWAIENSGGYGFDGSATSQYVNGVRSSSNQGNALADLELGYPVSGDALTGTTTAALREYDVAGYVQDDWKARSNLTLNIGLRYSFQSSPTDKNGHAALYILPSNTNSPGTWNANYGDWGPRVGFAYVARTKLVVRGGYGIYYAPILYSNLQFAVLYSPNVVAQYYGLNIANPVDIQNLFIANPPSVPGQGGFTIAKTLKDTSAQEWNLNLERALSQSTTFTLGYIGSVMRHQSGRADFNQPDALSPGNTSGKLDVRPYPYAIPTVGQLNAFNGKYNGLTAKLERRLTDGLQFLGSYTWSRALDVTDGDNSSIENIYKPQLTYGPASYNRTHNFVFSGIYALPFGPGKHFETSNNVFDREIIGGWQFTGIQQFATGQPIQVGANNNSDTSSDHPAFALVTCNPNAGFVHTRFHIYNANCFAQPGAGQYGTARSVTTQPKTFGTNIGLIKNFAITEHQQLQFRADAFNVFNHPIFTGGNGYITSPSLGLATFQANSPRTMQFALRYSF